MEKAVCMIELSNFIHFFYAKALCVIGDDVAIGSTAKEFDQPLKLNTVAIHMMNDSVVSS